MKRGYNPGQDGIDGAKADAHKRAVAERMCNEFKAFILEAMADGTMVNLDDVTEDLHVLDLVRSGMDLYYDLVKAELDDEDPMGSGPEPKVWP